MAWESCGVWKMKETRENSDQKVAFNLLCGLVVGQASVFCDNTRQATFHYHCF